MPIQDYVTRFPPFLPPDEVFDTVRLLHERCPVTHSQLSGGFWVINRYDDCLRVLREWETFPVGGANGRGAVRVPPDPDGVDKPTMIPIDLNPPLHRRYREILNPFFTPKRLAGHEPGFRRIIRELLDGFHHAGTVDIAHEFAKIFPAQVTFEELFGITDQHELRRVRTWVRKITYDLWSDPPDVVAGHQRSFDAWIRSYVRERREAEPRGDVIDALLQARVDGHALTDSELTGAVIILILGGFSTTADATGNLVVTLIDNPGLQDTLRADPSLIPGFVEEVLRLDPPVTSRARRCVQASAFDAELIPAGDRVLVNFTAANRDPAEFERPDDLQLDRPHNHHFSFGGGPHRCVGSTMARMTLRIAVEEILGRMRDIRFPDGVRETRGSFGTGQWRAVDALPVEFTPIEPPAPPAGRAS